MASHDAELALGVAASLEDSSTLSEGQDNGEDRMAELFPDDAPPPDGLDGLLTGVRQGKLRRKARIKAQASVNKVKRHRTICCVVSGLVIACVLVGLIILREGKNPLHLDQDCISLSHNLPPDFEPSGLTWHHGRQRLITVSDTGDLLQLSPLGDKPSSAAVAGAPDLEAVTVMDSDGTTVLLANEQTCEVLEFDLEAAQLTGRSWALDGLFPWDAKSGIEGMTFIPGDAFYGTANDSVSSEGHVVVCSQLDGNVYALSLPGINTVNGTAVAAPSVVSHIETPLVRDCSGLFFEHTSGALYVLSDDSDRLYQYALPFGSAAIVADYELPSYADQEGAYLLSINESDNLFIADDSGYLFRYFFPVRISCFAERPRAVSYGR